MYASSFRAEGKVNCTCSGCLASMESFLPVSLAMLRSPAPELVKDYDLVSTNKLLPVDFTKLDAFLEKGPMVFRSALA